MHKIKFAVSTLLVSCRFVLHKPVTHNLERRWRRTKVLFYTESFPLPARQSKMHFKQCMSRTSKCIAFTTFNLSMHISRRDFASVLITIDFTTWVYYFNRRSERNKVVVSPIVCNVIVNSTSTCQPSYIVGLCIELQCAKKRKGNVQGWEANSSRLRSNLSPFLTMEIPSFTSAICLPV